MNKVMFKYLRGYGIHHSSLPFTKESINKIHFGGGGWWGGMGNPHKKTPGFELQIHQEKRRNSENNQRPNRKLFSVYFIYCRCKGNDWPFAQTCRSICFQGALTQVWTVNLWKVILIVIFLSLSVNLDKICTLLSWEIPIAALKFWGEFYIGFPDLKSLLDNMGSK